MEQGPQLNIVSSFEEENGNRKKTDRGIDKRVKET